MGHAWAMEDATGRTALPRAKRAVGHRIPVPLRRRRIAAAAAAVAAPVWRLFAPHPRQWAHATLHQLLLWHRLERQRFATATPLARQRVKGRDRPDGSPYPPLQASVAAQWPGEGFKALLPTYGRPHRLPPSPAVRQLHGSVIWTGPQAFS